MNPERVRGLIVAMCVILSQVGIRDKKAKKAPVPMPLGRERKDFPGPAGGVRASLRGATQIRPPEGTLLPSVCAGRVPRRSPGPLRSCRSSSPDRGALAAPAPLSVRRPLTTVPHLRGTTEYYIGFWRVRQPPDCGRLRPMAICLRAGSGGMEGPEKRMPLPKKRSELPQSALTCAVIRLPPKVPILTLTGRSFAHRQRGFTDSDDAIPKRNPSSDSGVSVGILWV